MRLKVYRRISIPEPPGGGVVNGGVSYVSREGVELIQCYGIVVGSDRYDMYVERFSQDNGATWSRPRPVFRSRRVKGGVVRYTEPNFFLDEERNVLLRFFGKGFYPGDQPKLALWQVYYQVFDQQGRSWSKPEPVRGGDAGEGEVFPGIREGSLAVSCSYPIRTSRGKILVPAQVKAFDEKGRIWFPFPNYFSPFYEPVVLLGEWRRGRLVWEVGEKVSIDPNVSCRLCEPTVAELGDGTLVMISRGDNGAFPEKPGFKWLSVSEDGGYTWSKPKPLRFDDGGRLYSPSSCSYLFRSWRTGKLYWVANIVGRNPVGNRPRYPLVIAEFDEEKLAVKRRTVFIIDDRRPREPETVQLSNFRCYQDRVTGDLVLFMARYGEKPGKENILRSPLYMYRVELS